MRFKKKMDYKIAWNKIVSQVNKKKREKEEMVQNTWKILFFYPV